MALNNKKKHQDIIFAVLFKIEQSIWKIKAASFDELKKKVVINACDVVT
jgi:hypothetical protein